jgi:hypothetical protein
MAGELQDPVAVIHATRRLVDLETQPASHVHELEEAVALGLLLPPLLLAVVAGELQDPVPFPLPRCPSDWASSAPAPAPRCRAW